MPSQKQTEASWIPTQQLCVMELLSKHFLTGGESQIFSQICCPHIALMPCGGEWNIRVEETGPCQFQLVTSCEHLPGTNVSPGVGNTKETQLGKIIVYEVFFKRSECFTK